MNATEKRKLVRSKYSEIIGRNDYSQAKRDYCFKPYSNGHYYSDCSSSVSYSYKMALPNENFGVLNTAGMYNCKKFTIVPVNISKGQITNPEVLRIGDMLLYAGTDNSRPGCVGHVEMYWGYDSNGVHWLYGHGSGKPKKTKMTDKNKSRYNSKTKTKVGNKGLIRVMRFIQDDNYSEPAKDYTGVSTVTVKKGTWNIRNGAGTQYDIIATVKGGTVLQLVEMREWAYIKAGNLSGYISKKALED